MRFRFVQYLLSFLLIFIPDYALAADLGNVEANLDLTWVMSASALVMFMQVGFLLLEAGMVRSKNSINVAQKNLLDFVFSVAAFTIVGFMIAFGNSYGLIGLDWRYLGLQHISSREAGFFVFQVMFCGTAATIVSGAIAERIRLSSYVLASFFLSAIIFPLFAHWAWGAALRPNEGAFLANLGFIDFAGSSVVHGTGGWVALAGCMVLGAREGRFSNTGEPVRMAGHSPVLATTGGLLLFIGWLGFNGGSTLKANEAVAYIILNTVLAGGFGTVAGFVLGYKQDGYYLPEKSLSGLLGGLVAVTAGCAVLTPLGAIIIGTLGGLVAVFANSMLEHKWKIDDAVGAIGAHAFAGVVGTLGLALLAPADKFQNGRDYQFLIQALGVVTNFVVSFGLGFLCFWFLKRFMHLRASHEEELIGLNIAEHATRIGVGHVEDAMQKLLDGRHDGFSQRLPIVAGDEAENLTNLFNELMANLETEHKTRSELELLKVKSEEAERITALSNATFEGIAIHHNGRVIDGNRQIAELLEYSLDEIVGKDIMLFTDERHRGRIERNIAENTIEPYEAVLLSKSGERIPVAIRGRFINYKGQNVRISCIVDLRERKAAEEHIRVMAQHDALTGVANRSLFNTQLENAVKSATSQRAVALIIIDLDRFKNVNDVYGHPAGDIVIKETARRLEAISGVNDSVARLGGDEFALIQRNVLFTNQAADTGHRIVNELSKPISIDEKTAVFIGASVGIALSPEHAKDAETMFYRADIALYHSKNTGRNMSSIYQPGLNKLMEKRRALQAGLEKALQNDEFELYYQPRVDSKTLEVCSYEALLRWNHAEKGVVSPGEFIPVAEASGLIIDIDTWVFEHACKEAANMLEGQRLSINISPLAFLQRDFVKKIQETLERTGTNPARIELELTENMLIEDDEHGLAVMKQLKRLGLALALDDFGTGYSSLSYLSKYPFDTIKIDRNFVIALGQEKSAVAILKVIIGLGKGLGMEIVAEGVETVEEAAFLRENECDQLQGYLISRPMPARDILKNVSEEMKDKILNCYLHENLDPHLEDFRAMIAKGEGGEKRATEELEGAVKTAC
nr:ammonium transporter [uncultured Cohaesibacter sp.]